MKIKSLIVSLIATLVVFGTVSFAAEYDISLDPVIEYTAGTGYVEVKLVADETVTSVVGSSTARINFDSTVFELDSANTTTIAPSTVVMPQGVTAYAQWSSQDGIASMAGGTLANIRFNVKDGQEANVVGKEFYISLMVGNKSFDRTVTYTVGKNIKVAVTAAGGEEKTEATIGATGDVTFDYAEDDAAGALLAGKRVVLDTVATYVAGTDITETTKVAVTYTEDGNSQTKYFGETLYELLGLDGEGDVNATITFGIVCDPSMTGTFTFALN